MLPEAERIVPGAVVLPLVLALAGGVDYCWALA